MAVMTAIFENEEELLSGLQSKDERAFVRLVNKYGSEMFRVARRFVNDDASAEEVVQETWLAVLQGLATFSRRSALKSWMYAILVKRAMTAGKRQARQVPFSSLARTELESREVSVSPDRFEDASGSWPRHWRDEAMPAIDLPDAVLLGRETQRIIMSALEVLPPAQRTVVELRDIAGNEVSEIAEALELSDGNVRVLLHRGRSKIRGKLEEYLSEAR